MTWAASACAPALRSIGEGGAMRAIGCLFFLATPCQPRTKNVLPPQSRRAWAYMPSGDARPSRHVIRMSDGSRDWEVEFPDVATGYEVRIPLRGAQGMGPNLDPVPTRVTAADRELLEERSLEGGGEK